MLCLRLMPREDLKGILLTDPRRGMCDAQAVQPNADRCIKVSVIGRIKTDSRIRWSLFGRAPWVTDVFSRIRRTFKASTA